ncbi:hypothetical protein [Paramuribaculum intestinale]|uniref:hypothetical protein n=1 Tax=Paramuribaculum intestinale TaxID=2094151 RepID=UPI0026749A4D|nr:hypothetical protein [Paramuribaculum intestinale]
MDKYELIKMANPLLEWGAQEGSPKRGVIILAFENGDEGRGLHSLECVAGDEDFLAPALAYKITNGKDGKFTSILNEANMTIVAAKLFHREKEAQN